MNRATLFTRTLRLLATNSSAYEQTDFNSDLQEASEMRAMQILRLRGYKGVTLNQSFTDLISVEGLVEGDAGYNGEYAFPQDLLDIERIEVSFDGTNWETITKGNNLYGLNENLESEFDKAEIQGTFSTASPHATIHGSAIFIRPLPTTTISNGLHIYYQPRQQVIDEDTDSPFFEANLHQILAYDCAEMEMIAHPEKYDATKYARLQAKKANLEKEFASFYQSRLKPFQRLRSVSDDVE